MHVAKPGSGGEHTQKERLPTRMMPGTWVDQPAHLRLIYVGDSPEDYPGVTLGPVGRARGGPRYLDVRGWLSLSGTALCGNFHREDERKLLESLTSKLENLCPGISNIFVNMTMAPLPRTRYTSQTLRIPATPSSFFGSKVTRFLKPPEQHRHASGVSLVDVLRVHIPLQCCCKPSEDDRGSILWRILHTLGWWGNLWWPGPLLLLP